MKKREAYDVMDLKALRCSSAMGKHGSLTRAGVEPGIIAPIDALITLCDRYANTLLMVDEAHNLGVRKSVRAASKSTSIAGARSTCSWEPSARRSPLKAATSPARAS